MMFVSLGDKYESKVGYLFFACSPEQEPDSEVRGISFPALQHAADGSRHVENGIDPLTHLQDLGEMFLMANDHLYTPFPANGAIEARNSSIVDGCNCLISKKSGSRFSSSRNLVVIQ
jgi:hypothetical protein